MASLQFVTHAFSDILDKSTLFIQIQGQVDRHTREFASLIACEFSVSNKFTASFMFSSLNKSFPLALESIGQQLWHDDDCKLHLYINRSSQKTEKTKKEIKPN